MNVDEMTEPLADSERKELVKLEVVVSKGFFHMRECLEALLVIRDKRLYREDYPTFKEYCQEKWGKKRRAVDTMLATLDSRKEIEDRLKPNEQNLLAEKPLKTLVETASDHAVRELSKVPKRSQKRVLKLIAKGNGKLTASAVQQATAPKEIVEPPPEDEMERFIKIVNEVEALLLHPQASRYDGRTVKKFAEMLRERIGT